MIKRNIRNAEGILTAHTIPKEVQLSDPLPESALSDMEKFADTHIGHALRAWYNIPYNGIRSCVGPMKGVISATIKSSPKVGDVRYTIEHDRSKTRLVLGQLFAGQQTFGELYETYNGDALASLESFIEAYTDPTLHIGTVEFRKNKAVLFPNVVVRGVDGYFMVALDFDNMGIPSIGFVGTDSTPKTNGYFVAKRVHLVI